MPENKIDLKSISELLGMKFFIPSYQRGYKWRKKDVEYLIKDIAEISKEDKSDYCLQPIVVAPKPQESPTNEYKEYILVDGQQRLTTIWLIVHWATNHKKCDVSEYDFDYDFDIEYETRDKSNEFLKCIKDDVDIEEDGTCDTHYFRQALEAIDELNDSLTYFIYNLKKNVKIIWYEITPDKGPAHFERLNNAKISLTNAELVKAFLMTNSSQSQRPRMAYEWDEIEYKLQDKSFFSFITTKGSIYGKEYNRIELLLDLYIGTTKNDKEKDEHHTFNQIAKIIKEGGKSIEDIWQDILNIHNRLLCWYNDNFLYNLIGFLVEKNGDDELAKIWEGSKGKNILDFKENVRTRVIENTPTDEDVRSLVYKDGQTKNILLLFNILSLLSVDDKKNYKYFFNDKFHFDFFKEEDWDKEHVHATKSESLRSKVEWVNWLKDLDENLIKLGNPDKQTEYRDWIKKAKKIESEEDYKSITEDTNISFKSLSKSLFEVMFSDIVSALEGEDGRTDLNQNSIGNLVLLCANINRAGEYKVAPFSTKRRIIMERVKKGQFVPIGTQNVFMKVYTQNPGRFYKWEKDEPYDGNEKSDKDSYIDAIIETINRIR